MSWYLTIHPPADLSCPTDTRRLVEFLTTFPELKQTAPVCFESAIGHPWVHIILARTGATGGYVSDGTFIPESDIVEMVCSEFENPAWYDALAGRIAAFLGWVAVQEQEERQVWPLVKQGLV